MQPLAYPHAGFMGVKERAQGPTLQNICCVGVHKNVLHRRRADYRFMQDSCSFVEPIEEKGISFFHHQEWDKMEIIYHFFQLIFHFLPKLGWAGKNYL